MLPGNYDMIVATTWQQHDTGAITLRMQKMN